MGANYLRARACGASSEYRVTLYIDAALQSWQQGGTTSDTESQPKDDDMTMQFKVTFHRYRNGESRISAARFINVEDFHAASATAHLMALAMRDADPEGDFKIAEIATVGFRGKQCMSGWETDEEFSARVAEKAKSES